MSKTEKQIIQALKICKLDTTCVTCPYYGKSEAESCFSRLSADALSIIHKQKKQINQLTHKHYNECGQIAKYSDELNQFVNADKKVECGEWGKEAWTDTEQHICSLCHSTVRVSSQSVIYKYCPYCGAKMKGADK